MLYSNFKEVTFKLITEYINGINTKFQNELKLDFGQILFPNILLFTQTDEHFIFELIGSNTEHNGLKAKYNTSRSTNEYLCQFEQNEGLGKGEPLFFLNGYNHGLTRMKISRESDTKSIKERFGFIDRLDTHFIDADEREGPLIMFGGNFRSCYIQDCLFINKQEEAYRVKDILCMGIVSKVHSKKNYTQELRERLIKNPTSSDELFGVHFCDKQSTHKMILAGQFSNVFLVPGIHETTIGEFINNNPNFFKEAISCEDILYEKDFPWLEGNDDSDEKYINPDLMLRRKDGYYDICDLKTPKLSKKTLTKGGHKRRRFYDYVEEGIAQLANYEEYFMFEKNKDFAEKEFGVKINNPTLYLIVGNYENLKKEDVREASRRLKNQYRIIDFDTLHALYLNSVRASN